MVTLQSVRLAGTYVLLTSLFLFLSVGVWPIASDAAQSPLTPAATPEEVQTYEAPP